MKRILLIATGGTIACAKTEGGLAPALSPEELLARVPDAQSLCHTEAVQPFNLDSTNISPRHWLLLAQVIEKHYLDFDGFVICHGTDTLAYTAAALSYLIQHTRKPIVLTGAQKPIDQEDTDARQNLLDSLRYACSGDSGVCILFGGHVIAGTRARKTRTKSYNAFSSINFPDLAEVRDHRVARFIPCPQTGSPSFFHRLDTDVALLKLVPGLPAEAFAAIGRLCDGLVIESYGVGGIPDLYLEQLDTLAQAGKTIVLATQVPQEGSDISVYQVGHRVKERYHLLEPYDMTLEATVTKLMWVLGQSQNPEEIRRLFYSPVNFDLIF
ncbi:asparaginase [Acutalibacter sp. 1XD8-33]|uniref:asparaginase n=1 Tax=Acutalibacter sp. 1XD8-33 TaxID=2320081 RepID=UPI000EA093D1|nr:asparaginase [Acutalibacter sp. 1XD8-33]RKJ41203.1 asparaginase [Acutalibacter sp. 1XD8-33]